MTHVIGYRRGVTVACAGTCHLAGTLLGRFRIQQPELEIEDWELQMIVGGVNCAWCPFLCSRLVRSALLGCATTLDMGLSAMCLTMNSSRGHGGCSAGGRSARDSTSHMAVTQAWREVVSRGHELVTL